MPAGCPFKAWMLQPDLVRHDCRLHMERTRLQKPEAVLVHRPFDLDRPASKIRAFAQQTAERSPPLRQRGMVR